MIKYSKHDFGTDFEWGVAISSYQVEGAHDLDGRGISIWDKFSHQGKRIEDGSDGRVACEFYHRYEEDIDIVKSLNLKNFRFSLAWPRILPNGTGAVNQAGIDFYNKVIDYCLAKGVTPWLTLYHWDLPQVLEDKGGWTNRMIVNCFKEYADVCSRAFGDRVKNWIVINEPFTYTALGYLFGYYAPGKFGINNYIPAVHHSTLCQAEGARVIRRNVPDANIGTSVGCSHVSPASDAPRHVAAAKRIDVMFNRIHIEPLLGMDYPIRDLPALERIEKYIQPYDPELIKFDFDFIGVQNYYSLVAYDVPLVPYIGALIKPFHKLNRPLTANGWEVYPEGIYKILKQFGEYPIKKLMVTENGAAFHDKVQNGMVHDKKRVEFLQKYIGQVLRAKNEGVNIGGYFVWSLMDNFEWKAGFKSRFGIVHTDFKTQRRIIKDSGLWIRDFLED